MNKILKKLDCRAYTSPEFCAGVSCRPALGVYVFSIFMRGALEIFDLNSKIIYKTRGRYILPAPVNFKKGGHSLVQRETSESTFENEGK